MKYKLHDNLHILVNALENKHICIHVTSHELVNQHRKIDVCVSDEKQLVIYATLMINQNNYTLEASYVLTFCIFYKTSELGNMK